MKKLDIKKLVRRVNLALLGVMAAAYPVFASSGDKTAGTLEDVVSPIAELIESFLGPLLIIVGAVGTLYCVLLGVKYARAEEPQDREKAKQHLKSAIIGFVLIFVLIVALKELMPFLSSWVTNYK